MLIEPTGPTRADDVATVQKAIKRAAGDTCATRRASRASTCRKCATPAGGCELCWGCRQHRGIAGLADLLVPLTFYAVAGTKSAARWCVITRTVRCVGCGCGIASSSIGWCG